MPRELFPAPGERRDGRSPGLRVVAWSPPSRSRAGISGVWRYALRSQLRAQPRLGTAWPSPRRSLMALAGAVWARLSDAAARKVKRICASPRARRRGRRGARDARAEFSYENSGPRSGRRARDAWGRRGRFASPWRAPAGRRIGRGIRPCEAIMRCCTRFRAVFRHLRRVGAGARRARRGGVRRACGPCADRRGAALRRKVRWTGPGRADIPQTGTDSAFGPRRVVLQPCASGIGGAPDGASSGTGRPSGAPETGGPARRLDRKTQQNCPAWPGAVIGET